MDPRLKLTIPAEQIESGAWDQIKGALKLPFLEKMVILPDVHSGYDVPIGTAMVLNGCVWPGAVGYDIGCGMCHINTKKSLNELPPMSEVLSRLQRMIPAGFAQHEKPRALLSSFPNAADMASLRDAVETRAMLQLGTLGGGNHFIEIGVNSEGDVGITIHSGSRRAGWLIGDFYMKMSKGPVRTASTIGTNYLVDMEWAQQYALDNRSLMMAHCLTALGINGGAHATLMSTMINENHNHAVQLDNGRVLHRKGATPADKGQLGIIPANMRDGVWITEGLGNEEFLSSASHGAGRTMSRGAAKKRVVLEKLQEQMKGIVTPDLANMMDESPDAYKNITDVLLHQAGLLVEVLDRFEPVMVLKG